MLKRRRQVSGGELRHRFCGVGLNAAAGQLRLAVGGRLHRCNEGDPVLRAPSGRAACAFTPKGRVVDLGTALELAVLLPKPHRLRLTLLVRLAHGGEPQPAGALQVLDDARQRLGVELRALGLRQSGSERLLCSGRSRSPPAIELTVSDTLQSFRRAPAVATTGHLQGYC